jgi:NADH pyrophosphatase NudC (nudix superfamily)
MKDVVVGIIFKKDDSGKNLYLLVSTKIDYGEYTGFYYPPGGHIDNGGGEEETLVRKIKGELGLIVRPVRRIATTLADIPNQKMYWWLCDPSSFSEDFVIQDSEVSDADWFSENDIEQRQDIWPATRKFFQDYIFKS